MTAAKHTPEPWRVYGSEIISGPTIDDSNHAVSERIAEVWQRGHGGPHIANAARIVACVNACAGMDDPAAEITRLRSDLDGVSRIALLERGDYEKRLKAIRDYYNFPQKDAEIESLRVQRDELAAVIVQAIEAAGYLVSGPTDSRAAEHGEPVWVCNARAALVNVQP